MPHLRVTTKDTSLSGVEIPAGAAVTPVLASANRDPEAYDNPEAFDIFRDLSSTCPRDRPHVCLRMHLARMERVALNGLFDRLPNLRLDKDEASDRSPHPGDLLFRSPSFLPVMWDRA